MPYYNIATSTIAIAIGVTLSSSKIRQPPRVLPWIKRSDDYLRSNVSVECIRIIQLFVLIALFMSLNVYVT